MKIIYNLLNILIMLSITCVSFKLSGFPRKTKLLFNNHRYLSMSDEINEITTSTMPLSFKSKFLTTMKDRGFIHQCTNFVDLDRKFSNGTVTAYLGFDATAKSLHVGSLLQIMILRTLQKSGINIVFIIVYIII